MYVYKTYARATALYRWRKSCSVLEILFASIAHMRGPSPNDDERDDGAAVESKVARTARAVHLRHEGSGITPRIRSLLDRRSEMFYDLVSVIGIGGIRWFLSLESLYPIRSIGFVAHVSLCCSVRVQVPPPAPFKTRRYTCWATCGGGCFRSTVLLDRHQAGLFYFFI